MIDLPDLETLDAEQLRQAVRHLAQQVKFNKALIDKLTHENALLKRLKFAAHSERYTPEQRSLLEDEIEADLAAVALEIEQLAPRQREGKKQPKRLPRRAAWRTRGASSLICMPLAKARLPRQRWRSLARFMTSSERSRMPLQMNAKPSGSKEPDPSSMRCTSG